MDHPWRLLALAGLLTLVSGVGAYHLTLDTKMERLLPPEFPSVERLARLQERVGNQSDLVFSIKSADREANIRYGARLTALLEQDTSIRFVQFRRDLEQFERQALLYLSLDKLEQIRRDVSERIRLRVSEQMELGLDERAAGPPGEAAAVGGDEVEDDEFDRRDKAQAQQAAAEAAARAAQAKQEAAEEAAARRAAGEQVEEEPPAPAAGAAAGQGAPLELVGAEEFRRRYAIQDLQEYTTNGDGTMLVIRARTVEGTTDIAEVERLVGKARRAIERARDPSDPPDLTVELLGHHLQRLEEIQSVGGNQIASALACLGLLMGLMAVYFRRKRAMVLIFVPLGVSVIWSLGLAWLTYGYLNVISAFIFAVLLGLGIEYGIYVLARFDEAIRAGLPARQAIRASIVTAGRSAAAGCLTTAVVFLLLMVGDFRGFSQFGFIAGLGVLISLGAVFTLMPALIVLFERRAPWPARIPGRFSTRLRAALLPRLRPLPAGVLAGVVCAVSLVGTVLAVRSFGGVQFEYSFNELGPRPKPEAAAHKQAQAAAKAAAAKERENQEALGSMGASTIVITEDLGQTERMHRQFELLEGLTRKERRALAAARGPGEPGLERLQPLLAQYPLAKLKLMAERLREPFSIFTFVPQEQEAKLRVIADIRTRLLGKRSFLTPQEQTNLDSLMKYLDPTPLGVDTLPEWVRVQFREPNTGQEGRFVILRTRGSKVDIRQTLQLKEAFFDLRDQGRAVQSAAAYFVLPEIMETIWAELPLVVGAALAGLVIILLLHFRSPRSTLMVLLPLCASVIWTVGLLVLLGVKLNFFNIVVIPLLLGMGIDSTVHLYERYLEEPEIPIGRLIWETGGAVFMVAFTTAIGFAGMFFADHRGLNSMAAFAIIGLGFTLLSGVATLPAMLQLGRFLRTRRTARAAAARPA